jgi:hypothetical protein
MTTVSDASPDHIENEAVTRRNLLVPLTVFVVGRTLLLVLVRFGTSLIPPSHRYPSVLPAGDPLSTLGPWARNWFRFDAKWYVDVAQHGYHLTTPSASNTNFFPLYPLLIRALQPLTLGSPWIAAWLIANLAFGVAIVLVWRWSADRRNERIALRAILLMSVFPFSFFFAAPYAESLFVATAAGAFLAADRRRWVWAAALAGLAGITRPVGLAVVAGLIVFAFVRADRSRAALCALSILPFLAFVAYLWALTGNPLAFTIYHSAGWVPPHGGVLTTLGSQFHTRLSPFDRIDAAAALLFLVSAVPVWRRIGPGYAVFVAGGVILPLLHGLVSMERYVIVLYPVFAVWALGRNRLVQPAIFGVSLFLLILACSLFAGGYAVF